MPLQIFLFCKYVKTLVHGPHLALIFFSFLNNVQVVAFFLLRPGYLSNNPTIVLELLSSQRVGSIIWREMCKGCKVQAKLRAGNLTLAINSFPSSLYTIFAVMVTSDVGNTNLKFSSGL